MPNSFVNAKNLVRIKSLRENENSHEHNGGSVALGWRDVNIAGCLHRGRSRLRSGSTTTSRCGSASDPNQANGNMPILRQKT